MRNIPKRCDITPNFFHYFGINLIQLIDEEISMVDSAPEHVHQMHQICPFCKKLVTEEDTICPYCNNLLTSENKTCPFCKKQISDEDTLCPHCNNLLIYEYPKQVAAKRNKVLFPLGFLLLFSIGFYSFLDWRGLIQPNRVIGGIFMIFWLIGLVFYGAYIGKGDKDFWWGR